MKLETAEPGHAAVLLAEMPFQERSEAPKISLVRGWAAVGEGVRVGVKGRCPANANSCVYLVPPIECGSRKAVCAAGVCVGRVKMKRQESVVRVRAAVASPGTGVCVGVCRVVCRTLLVVEGWGPTGWGGRPGGGSAAGTAGNNWGWGTAAGRRGRSRPADKIYAKHASVAFSRAGVRAVRVLRPPGLCCYRFIVRLISSLAQYIAHVFQEQR